MKIVDNVLIKVKDKDIPFDGCYIVPDTVKAIALQAFVKCDKLVAVVIPVGVKCIEKEAFALCKNLQLVSLPESLTAIGENVFFECYKLSVLIIPQGVTRIGSAAFWGCQSLTTLTIPKGVTRIEKSTFFGCTNLHSVCLPEGLTSIDDNAFGFCESLRSLIIPREVITVGEGAFSSCENLTTLTLPQGVTIEPFAFEDCKKLAIIVIDADTSEALQGVKNQLPEVLKDRVLSKEEYQILQQKKQDYLTNHFLELIAKKHIKSLSEVLSPIITHSFFSVMPTDLLNTVTPYAIELHPDYQNALPELAKLEIPVVRDDEGAINWEVYQKQFGVELDVYFNNHFLPTNAKQAQPVSHDVSVEVTKALPSNVRANRP